MVLFLQKIFGKIIFATIWMIATSYAVANDETASSIMWDRFGIAFDETDCFAGTHPDCKLFYVSELRQDGPAELAGVRVGDFLQWSKPTFAAMKPSRFTVELYNKELLYQIRGRLFVNARRGNVEEIAALAKEQNSLHGLVGPKSEFQQKVYLNFLLLEEHLGIRVDDLGYVLSVIPGSVSDVAGIQVGDQAYSTHNAPTDSRHMAYEAMFRLFALTQQSTPKSHRFVRNGETISIEIPVVKMGDTINPKLLPPKLEPETAKVFELLPRLAKPILEALYVGNFERVDLEKQKFYRLSFQSSIFAHLGENELAFELRKEMEKRAENGRFQPLLAHYALVKARYLGLCKQRAFRIPYTTKTIQTITNGYGISLGSSVIKEESSILDVDIRFAEFVLSSEWLHPRAGWTGGFKSFIEAAGGCNSQILATLEKNMLAYQDH